jgi:hypothetical protein
VIGKAFATQAVRGSNMTSFQIRTAALLVSAVALTAAPSFAQRPDRRDRGGAERREGDKAQPRRQSESRERGRDDSVRRAEQYRRDNNRGFESRAFDNRRRDDRRYDNRWRGNRGYTYRSYGYRPHYRSYVVPYGYRPFGYRPGWSLNLYFGRPYRYVYPGYGYPSAGYGYYPITPGRPYGAVRIVDAPRDAQVFVDGYYAGVVDDYDGVFQRLNLEGGSHHIEIQIQDYPPIAFDVYIEPGRTITLHARLA